MGSFVEFFQAVVDAIWNVLSVTFGWVTQFVYVIYEDMVELASGWFAEVRAWAVANLDLTPITGAIDWAFVSQMWDGLTWFLPIGPAAVIFGTAFQLVVVVRLARFILGIRILGFSGGT